MHPKQISNCQKLIKLSEKNVIPKLVVLYQLSTTKVTALEFAELVAGDIFLTYFPAFPHCLAKVHCILLLM